MKLTCVDIELAVVSHFRLRQQFAIVPNVSWGLDLHECDLLVVRPSGYAVEVEIKTTRSDLKKDGSKRHRHESSKIKELYFAVPSKLVEDALALCPESSGIIAVSETTFRATRIRDARAKVHARPLNKGEMLRLGRLAAMRIWGLKEKLVRTRREQNKKTA